jgi:signal transduction histidine kinase
MRRPARGALIVAAMGLTALAPAEADAHLFHKSYEPPETQMTRDTRLIQLLLDDPSERFDLARRVWEGTERVRLKPGGFRRWLVRPNEPGMVFKADYQLQRWSGSLKDEAARIDREHRSALEPRIEAALAARDRDGVKTALREMYAVMLGELLESLWQRLDQPETAARLYGFVLRYYTVNLEGYLNVKHPAAATTAQAALDGMARTLADAESGAPPSPEAFDQQRRRVMRVIGETIPLQ